MASLASLGKQILPGSTHNISSKDQVDVKDLHLEPWRAAFSLSSEYCF